MLNFEIYRKFSIARRAGISLFIYNADKIYVEKRTAMLPLMLPYVQYHLLPDVSY